MTPPPPIPSDANDPLPGSSADGRTENVRRVLMTTDAVGGVWSYTLELTRGLARFGTEVVLATMGPRMQAEQRAKLAELPHITVRESDFRLEWMEDPWRDLAAAGEWLLELEREFQPDVVHLNGYVHAALNWSAPTLVVGHSCVLSWWRAVKGEDAPESWQHYAHAVRKGIAAANLVVAPTQAMLDALELHYGPIPRARVIYNGRDPAHFAARVKEPFVLCAGRLWDEAKNAHALTAIAPRLSWPVRLVGDTRAPDKPATDFPNLELIGRCPLRDLAVLYARASLYVLPARYEPFGLSVLEAALSGCALVLGDIPSLRELWQGAAVFVAPDDHDALAETIEALTHAPAQVARLAGLARERAQRFSVESVTDGYAAAYAELRARADVDLRAAQPATFA